MIPFACGCLSVPVFHCVCLSPIDSLSSQQGDPLSCDLGTSEDLAFGEGI